MFKKKFKQPYIFGLTPGEDIVIGNGSGEDGFDPDQPNAVSFASWMEHYAEDIDGSQEIDYQDYLIWWGSYDFTQEDWEDVNPDIPWPFGN